LYEPKTRSLADVFGAFLFDLTEWWSRRRRESEGLDRALDEDSPRSSLREDGVSRDRPVRNQRSEMPRAVAEDLRQLRQRHGARAPGFGSDGCQLHGKHAAKCLSGPVRIPSFAGAQRELQEEEHRLQRLVVHAAPVMTSSLATPGAGE
jgi:hypothetical protein